MMFEKRSAWAGMAASLLIHGLIAFAVFHSMAMALVEDAPKDNEVLLRLENFQPPQPTPPAIAEGCPAPVVEEPEPFDTSDPEPEPAPEKPIVKETPAIEPAPVKKTRKKRPVKKTQDVNPAETPKAQARVNTPAGPTAQQTAEKRAALERRVIRRLLALIEQERIYPYSARRMGLNGKAEIVVTLNPGGRISGFNVSSASHGVFRKAALTTMQRVAGRNEQLDPWLLDSIKVRVPLVFTIKE